MVQMNPKADNLVTIGKVLKPHGVKGAVKILPTTDDPQRFRLVKKICLYFPVTGKFKYLTIEHANIQSTGVLIKFVGVNDRSDAELLRDCELTIEESECLPLADDAYYYFQLQGLQVYDLANKHLGEIIKVLQYPAHDIYVLRYGIAEVMIPAVAEFIKKIDIEAGKMIIKPVDGLLPEE